MAARILISDIGGGNEQRLPTNGISRSWAVETPGTLSAELLTETLVQAGLTQPKGRWVRVEANDVGTWAGVVQETQPRDDGTTELTATDWRILLSDRRLSRRARPLFGPPGTLALAALADAERHGPVWVRDRTADETGQPVELRLDGQTLGSALDGLARASGAEWRIDPDTMAFSWGRSGTDRSATRQLVAPRHIVSYTLPDSIAPVINDLLVYALDDRTELRRAVRVENVASIAAHGRRQDETVLAMPGSVIALRPAAQALVNRLAYLGQTFEAQLVNVDRCFGWVREGDTIACLLPGNNQQVTVRIMARSLSEPDGIMAVSGIVTDRRIG
jgi:hypothetical protein